MSRRVKKKVSLFAPLAENLAGRLARTNTETRRRLVRWGGWILGLLFLYSLMIGTFSVPRIVRLEAERRHLLQANRLQAAALIDACRVRDMLQHDRLYIEQIARQRFHLVYPGETLYRYGDK
jgi:cell division protein FtsB